MTQINRNAGIGTPLGDDVLVLKTLTGTEQLGRLFQFELELLSEDHEIPFEKIIGENVTIRLVQDDGKQRYFNGFVSRFTQRPTDPGEYARYQATIVPWLWFLTRTADCRIFQKKTIPDIIEQVFKDQGFDHFERRLSATYGEWDYCVQYRETDFNFVSRLMEQEGIYYYFRHEDGKHTLILADSPSAHDPYEGYDKISYRADTEGGTEGEHIRHWEMTKELLTGVYAHKDFNFEKPKVDLQVRSGISREHNGANYEVYDYPGEYGVAGDGEAYAKLRIEEIQARYDLAQGRADARGICTGFVVEIEELPRADQNRKYLVISASHSIQSDVGESTGAAGGGTAEDLYQCSFACVESATHYRSPRLTPKPIVQGPQTAFVVGPKGEEIHTDKYGRVKVLFHWDRHGKPDENSSCWVRVAQSWAGKKWGSIYTPRIGQEVIVEFLEGDPDQPIITGRVYNAEAMPPYELPGMQTISTLKSNSSKGGAGFNEIRFEDKKGEENLFIHAEKDYDTRVKNDAKTFIGNERHLILKKDDFETVEGNRNSTVKGNVLSKVEGDQGETIKGNHLTQVDGNEHLTVKGDLSTKVDGEVNLKGGADISQESTGKYSVKSGGDLLLKSGGNYAVDAATAIHLKGGMKVVIEGSAQVTMKVGGNFVDINPGGVFIKGTMVMINSGGSAGSGDGCSPKAPAAPEAPDPPKDPKEPIKTEPGKVDEPPPAPKPPEPKPPSSAAKVLQQAAQDGTPFCEECARAAQQALEEELAVISSIAFLDGSDDQELSGDGVQWVNLPKAAKWVDAANQIGNEDRLTQKPRFKVTFSIPGSHEFKVKAVAADENAAYTDPEKGRNTNFKWMEEEKSYTTGADGTKIVESDFFFTCAGGDKFKLVAEDTNNNPPVETGWLQTRRVAYLVPIKMTGMTTAASLATMKSEFATHGLDIIELPEATMDRLANISTADENTFKNNCKTAFDGSQGKDKNPYAVAIGFTEHLAVKNSNIDLELTGVTVGPGEAAVDVPVEAQGLRSGDGLRARALWKNLVPGEGWFVSASYTPDGGGAAQNIVEASCTPSPAGADYCDTVSVDVTGLPAGTGTLRLRVNVVDRMRAGLSFSGGNLICVCTKAWWQDSSAAEQNSVAIHEMGHKVGMVSDGTGKLPDAVTTLYSGKGHVGNHCHFDLPVQDTYSSATGSQCVMFGSVDSRAITPFCENCIPAVKKMDLSAGWPAS